MTSDLRRQLILGAAKRCFARHGYTGTTTKSVAAAAAISEALLFKHFPSKAALYAEAAGETLGLLKSVSESQGYDQPQPLMMKADLAAAPASVPVATGELSFAINVQVTWAVEY